MINLPPFRFDEFVAAAVKAPQLSVAHLSLNVFPMLVFGAKELPYRAAAGYVAHVTGPDGDRHTVCVALYHTAGGTAWGFWCGHKFHEQDGHRLTPAEGRSMCEVAALGMPNADALIARMMSQFQQFPPSTPCDFWNGWRRTQTACEHVQAVLAHLRETVPEFRICMREMLDQTTGATSANA